MSVNYAVIRTGGKQYRVAPGMVVRVETLSGESGGPVEFAEVLLASVNDEVRVGTPVLADARVTGRIVEQGKAKKVLVLKKKRRKNYRRKYGHRQPYTAVQVTAIHLGGQTYGP
jgi:large subunit ribosomal protein L21